MPNPSIQSAPVLHTEHLVLRPHTLDDYGDSARMWADPEVTRHIGGRPSTAEEAWSRVLRYAGLWALLGFSYWVVRERETGRFVGEVGFADFRRELTPPLEGAPEAGWALAPWAQGRGFATEAVRAALAWGDAHLAVERTVCMIHPDNAPSIRVAEKCGFRQIASSTYKGEPTLLFERRPG